jgi:hypothetical protein
VPIRTPRGRSSAYRAIWQWPLHSPLRLALSLVVLLAVAVGISLVITANRPPDSTTGTSASTTAPPSSGSVSRPPASPTVLPPVAPLTPSALPLEQAPQPALQAAAAWAAAWVNHPDGVSAQQWLAGLRPYTTDEYLGLLGTVDPSKVPANRIVGSPVPTQAAPASVQARVQTDTIALLVLVVDTGPGTGWRVADSDEA